MELALEVTPGPPVEIVPEGPGVMDAGIPPELDAALETSPWVDAELLVEEAPVETGESEIKENIEVLDIVLLEKRLAVDEDLAVVCVDAGLATACARCRRGTGAAGRDFLSSSRSVKCRVRIRNSSSTATVSLVVYVTTVGASLRLKTALVV